MKIEAEIGATWPQTKKGWEPPEAGGGKKDPPLEPPEGARPCRHLDLRRPASGTVREGTLSQWSWETHRGSSQRHEGLPWEKGCCGFGFRDHPCLLD